MIALLRRWVLPAAAVLALAGCATATAQPVAPGSAGPAAGERPAATRSTEVEPPVSRAREGRAAASERIRFRPRELILSRGGGTAAVEIASTVDGELRVPEDVRHLGWWDGGAYAGDPFGSTVIAGHVDSKTQGLGFFARLLRAQRGDVVTLRGEDDHRQRYRITTVRSVSKQALAASSDAFDQSVGHRLVLITCTGDYDPNRGGYQRNLVIYADPVGFAT